MLSCFAGVFGSHRLFYGGPIANDKMHALHVEAGLQGSVEVQPAIPSDCVAPTLELFSVANAVDYTKRMCATQVLPGLFCGGLPDAVESNLAGRRTADKFRCCCRCGPPSTNTCSLRTRGARATNSFIYPVRSNVPDLDVKVSNWLLELKFNEDFRKMHH